MSPKCLIFFLVIGIAFALPFPDGDDQEGEDFPPFIPEAQPDFSPSFPVFGDSDSNSDDYEPQSLPDSVDNQEQSEDGSIFSIFNQSQEAGEENYNDQSGDYNQDYSNVQPLVASE